MQIMKYLSKVFVSSIPSDIFLGILFQYVDNESMLVKCFEPFRGARPDEYNYSLSQLMALISIVNAVLGDSDCSTTGIKCHFFFLQFYFIFFKPPLFEKVEMPFYN